MPNKRESAVERLLRFNESSSVFLIASSGVMALSFRAGSHADIPMVIPAARSVIRRISGWYPNTVARLPSTSRTSVSSKAINPLLPTMPSKVPAIIGTAHKTAASCKRQIRICFGVAPILDNMPN